MVEITLPPDRPSPGELTVVRSVLGPPDSPWRGGARSGPATRVAVGLGPHRPRRRSLLLPTLVALQEAIGWISRGAIRAVAEHLEVPPAEVWGVATFYGLLDMAAPTGDVVHVCTDIVCRDGARRIAELRAEGVDARESPCLGQCDRGSGELRTRPWSTPAGATTVGGTLRLLADREPFSGLVAALGHEPSQVIDVVEASGLQGRGGAAFPVGVKWRAAAAGRPGRFIVCNADESEPGTFKDRLLLAEHSRSVVEGMTIAGYAVGATQGFAYIRGEYPEAREAFVQAIGEARELGHLGSSINGTDFEFDIEVRSGAGAYICGEETALLNSIEGHRGEPRSKPPFPTEVGLFGRPTVINNVETLANIPRILTEGAAAFRSDGTSESPGTKLFSVSGDVAAPGVYELPLGTPLGDLLSLAGAPEPRAVLVGGAAGSFVTDLDLALSYEGARAAGISLGSGSIIAFGPSVDLMDVCRRMASFFAHESCGQCVPCRVGTVRQAEALAEPGWGPDRLAVLSDIDRAMTDASICGLGQTAASAIRSAIRLGLIGGS